MLRVHRVAHAFRRPVLAVVACVALVTLAACSFGGYDPDVRLQRAGTTGVNAKISDGLMIRDAFVTVRDDVAQAGSTAYLRILALNSTDDPDSLVSVTTKAANQITTTDSATVPPKETYALGSAEITVALEDLTKTLRGGDSITVTVRFRSAGSSTFQVPVVRGTEDFATYLPSLSPTPALTANPSVTPTATPTATATSTASATPTITPPASPAS